MKHLLLIALLSLCACSSARLKRCPMPVEDDTIWSCPDHVDGPFYKCRPPKDLFRCEDVK